MRRGAALAFGRRCSMCISVFDSAANRRYVAVFGTLEDASGYKPTCPIEPGADRVRIKGQEADHASAGIFLPNLRLWIHSLFSARDHCVRTQQARCRRDPGPKLLSRMDGYRLGCRASLGIKARLSASGEINEVRE